MLRNARDLLLAALVLSALPVTAARGDFSWVNPLPQGNALLAGQAVTDDDVWFVGALGAVLHTTDGGKTFTLVPSGTRADLTSVWVARQGGHDRVFVVGGDGAVRASMDGAHFKAVRPAVDGSPEPQVIVGSGAGDVWVGGENGLILHSGDAGKTWAQSEATGDPWLHAAWAADSSHVVFGGSGGTLVSTSDGGKTWTQACLDGKTPPCDGYDVETLTGGPNGELYAGSGAGLARGGFGKPWTGVPLSLDETVSGVWASSDNRLALLLTASAGQIPANAGLFLSPDGGKTFARDDGTPPADVTFLVASGPTATRLYGGGLDGALLASTDGGQSWSELSRNLASSDDLVGVVASRAAVFALGEEGVLRSTDGGATFTSIGPNVEDEASAIWASSDGDVILVVYRGGAIERSADGGKTFTDVSGGHGSGLYGITGTAATLIATGPNGVVLRSTDEGLTWAPTSSGTSADLRLAVTDAAGHFYVGSEDSLSVSTDSGNHFAPVGGSGELAGRPPLSMSALWSDGSHTLVAAGYEPGPQPNDAPGPEAAVARSTDGGKTWDEVSLGDGMLYGLAAVGHTLYAAGMLGALWSSTDKGKSWKAVAVPTQEDLWAASGDGAGHVLVVGTYGTILRGP
jgi:photosystem II stability/assembly factor-like uncharacterized protein